MSMKLLFSLFILMVTTTVYSNPVESLRSLIGYGTYQGVTESGERCSLEIDRLKNGVRIFLFNPRVNRFEFGEEDHYELLENGIKISAPPEYEDNARITNRFVLSGRVVGIEREFCTYKCWVSMRPCILD
ncbi:MAG TPA: hypothetical protein VKY27_03195 [Bacteriovoracaceae bacterium]|nr:hypothetical protein [Bacteriovoracaceae bacterium]